MTLLEWATQIKNKISARLTNINTALKEKGQTEASTLDDVPAKIRAIEAGTDVSIVTATAGDVLSPKKFVDSSGKTVTGTIATKTSSNLSVSGATVTVPAGYYASQTSKSVSTATQATPSIEVSSTGLITASATQSAGYVSSGTKSGTKQLSTKGTTTYTPGINEQYIYSGYYITGTQIIEGDSNLMPGNIKSGVSIFGVNGTYEPAITTCKVTIRSINPIKILSVDYLKYDDGELTRMNSTHSVNTLSLVDVVCDSNIYVTTNNAINSAACSSAGPQILTAIERCAVINAQSGTATLDTIYDILD